MSSLLYFIYFIAIDIAYIIIFIISLPISWPFSLIYYAALYIWFSWDRLPHCHYAIDDTDITPFAAFILPYAINITYHIIDAYFEAIGHDYIAITCLFIHIMLMPPFSCFHYWLLLIDCAYHFFDYADADWLSAINRWTHADWWWLIFHCFIIRSLDYCCHWGHWLGILLLWLIFAITPLRWLRLMPEPFTPCHADAISAFHFRHFRHADYLITPLMLPPSLRYITLLDWYWCHYDWHLLRCCHYAIVSPYAIAIIAITLWYWCHYWYIIYFIYYYYYYMMMHWCHYITHYIFISLTTLRCHLPLIFLPLAIVYIYFHFHYITLHYIFIIGHYITCFTLYHWYYAITLHYININNKRLLFHWYWPLIFLLITFIAIIFIIIRYIIDTWWNRYIYINTFIIDYWLYLSFIIFSIYYVYMLPLMIFTLYEYYADTLLMLMMPPLYAAWLSPLFAIRHYCCLYYWLFLMLSLIFQYAAFAIDAICHAYALFHFILLLYYYYWCHYLPWHDIILIFMLIIFTWCWGWHALLCWCWLAFIYFRHDAMMIIWLRFIYYMIFILPPLLIIAAITPLH